MDGWRSRRIARTATAAAAAGVAFMLAASAVPASAAQEFFWEWSDGVDAKSRTFTKAAYKNPGRLPQLVVTAEPATPQQYVKLQYKQGGTWKREDGAATNSAGSAYLTLNPMCESGTWCEGTYKYRAIIDGRYTTFTITYSLG